MNMRTTIVTSIAKKEIMDNIRNKWIIITAALFMLLTLVVSYFGSYGQGWQNLGETIGLMMALVQILIPIIGLLLGYATITGEIEQGSMSSLLSLPATRTEILIGKFLGLGVVMSLTILFGFGFAGGIIALNVQNVNYIDYGIFIGASILIGLVFVSFSLLLSSFFKKRSTTIGGAIFFWAFFTIIFGMILSGILYSTVLSGVNMTQLINGEIHLHIPDWYYGISLLNPISAYSALVGLNVGPVTTTVQQGAGGIITTYPSFYSSGLMITILLLWIALFLCFAILIFKRRDV